MTLKHTLTYTKECRNTFENIFVILDMLTTKKKKLLALMSFDDKIDGLKEQKKKNSEKKVSIFSIHTHIH